MTETVAEKTNYFKSLSKEHLSSIQTFDWKPYLPKGKRPGKWTPTVEKPVVCRVGWHVSIGELGLLQWLNDEIYLVEIRGNTESQEDKIACSSVRLTQKTLWNAQRARLFAADCAASVLKTNAHESSIKVVEIARKFALGTATEDELSAARSTAGSAAGSTAYYAARSAARSTAYYAARSTAYYAACSAACSAAYSAARSAAGSWQSERLKLYLWEPKLPEFIEIGSDPMNIWNTNSV